MDLGSGLTGRVVTSVDDLGLKDPPGMPVWTSSDWWRFVAADPGHEMSFLVVSDSGGPLAVAPFLTVRGASELLFYNPPRIAGDFSAIGAPHLLEAGEREAVSRAGPALAAARPRLYPSLAVGVYGSNLGLRAVDGHLTPDLPVVVPAVARFAAGLGLASHALLYLDPEQDAALRPAAPALGLQRVLFGAEGILDVPAGDYLLTLPSGRRNTVRREMRSYASAGLRTEVATGPSALTEEHVALRSALRAKYGHESGEAWARAEFDALRRTVGENLVVFSARRGDRVVGYLMALRRGDVLYTRAAGFDYAAAAGAFCYFNLVYYDVIRWAREAGVHRIHYGLGTSAAKHHRGCRLMPRWAYFHLSDPVVRDTLRTQHRTAARLLAGLGVPA
jgi:hypothetical protein